MIITIVQVNQSDILALMLAPTQTKETGSSRTHFHPAHKKNFLSIHFAYQHFFPVLTPTSFIFDDDQHSIEHIHLAKTLHTLAY